MDVKTRERMVGNTTLVTINASINAEIMQISIISFSIFLPFFRLDDMF